MYKNQTPQQLSFFIAGISAGAIAMMLLFLKLTGFLAVTWPEVLGLFFLAFGVAFLTNYYLVRYFIFRRIKLIYKIIHRQKLPAEFKATNLDMTKNVLDDVEKEVGEWAEKQELELNELERLATYRRRFIGDVSHELKTPIFNIQGFIHTLLDGALDDPKVNLLYLQRAAKNIERLQTIVEDLETINKLEAGQMILDLQDFDLRTLTDDVFSDLEMRAHERNIRLTYK